jgi:putative tat pathway signal sequence
MERMNAGFGQTQRPLAARVVDSARTFVAARLRAIPGIRHVMDACSVVTSFGWLVIGAAIAGFVGAILAGWAEAFALFVACLSLLIIAIILVAAPSPYRVFLRLAQERVVAGQTALGEIRVVNDAARRGGSEVIELPIGTGVAEFVIPGVSSHETWDEFFSVLTRRRGVIEIGPARTVRSDGLGLLRRVRSWDNPVTLYVHPRTVRIPFEATGFQVDVEGVVTAKLSSSDVSFHALRDYEPGDDRRAVHWQSTARLGKLIVRQYEETHRSHHLIVLDTSRSSWDRDSFEDGVSVAASLALAGISASRTVSFAAGKTWVPATNAGAMLDALSSLPMSGRDDITALARRAYAARPAASYVSIVAPPSVSDAEAAHLAQVTPRDVTVQVLRINPKRRPRRRRLEGGVLYDCPSLRDLAHLVGDIR